MKHSEDISKIAPAIVLAASELKLVGKSGENTFDKYRYSKLDDYVRIVHPVLAKHLLSALTSVDSVTPLPERTTKSGNKENVVMVQATTTLVHTSGQWVSASCFGEGQDRSDKATYKAITGARKYGLACLFNIATCDDAEIDGPTDTPPQRQTPKPPAKGAKSEMQIKIEKWFGYPPEETKLIAAAWSDLKGAAGVGKDATKEEAGNKVRAFCDAAWAASLSFEEAMKGAKK